MRLSPRRRRQPERQLLREPSPHDGVVARLLALFGQAPADPPGEGMEEVGDLQQVAERARRGVQPPKVDELVEQDRVERFATPGLDQRRRQQDARSQPPLNQGSADGVVTDHPRVHRPAQTELGAELVDAPVDLRRQRFDGRAHARPSPRGSHHLDGHETEHADAPGQEKHSGR